MTIRCIVARDDFTAKEVRQQLKLDPHDVILVTNARTSRGVTLHFEELFVHSLPKGWTDEDHYALMMCIVPPSQPTGKNAKPMNEHFYLGIPRGRVQHIPHPDTEVLLDGRPVDDDKAAKTLCGSWLRWHITKDETMPTCKACERIDANGNVKKTSLLVREEVYEQALRHIAAWQRSIEEICDGLQEGDTWEDLAKRRGGIAFAALEQTVPGELLNADELRAMELSGELASLLRKICSQEMLAWREANPGIARGSEPESQQDHDWKELVVPIHHIQNKIMAQAAARAYPGKFRLIGEVRP